MSSSGLIYAVIVGLWAVYLVPMWLRRQDELAESGSQDRIFTAMRVLARRPAGPPAGPPAGARAEAARRRAPTAKTAGPRKPARSSRRRAALLARRRRAVSVLFLTFTAGSVLTAGYGMVWVWLPAVTGILLSLYIAYLRAQERRRAELRERRRMRASTPSRGHHGSESTERMAPARRGVATMADNGPARTPEDRRGNDPDAWDPVPVPLPTYVTAPVVTDGQAWTSQRHPSAGEPATSEPVAGAESPTVYDQYSDPHDHPRAVND